MVSKQIILVTGPARSGKSEWAETLARQRNQPVIYLATSLVDPDDLDWLERIKTHQRRRPSQWKTLEVPQDLTKAIADISGDHCLLIDSVGTWVANRLELEPKLWQQTVKELLEVLQTTSLTLIFVAEETGWGVIPSYSSGRIFRDRLGALTRQIAQVAHITYLVTGGYVLNLTQLGKPLC